MMAIKLAKKQFKAHMKANYGSIQKGQIILNQGTENSRKNAQCIQTKVDVAPYQKMMLQTSTKV